MNVLGQISDLWAMVLYLERCAQARDFAGWLRGFRLCGPIFVSGHHTGYVYLGLSTSARLLGPQTTYSQLSKSALLLVALMNTCVLTVLSKKSKLVAQDTCLE